MMISLTTPQQTTITIDTVRIAYMELSFDNAGGRAILQYGSTAQDGAFTEARREIVTLDPTVDGFADALSNARDAFEALLLVAPPAVEAQPARAAIVAVEATQVTEATVGKLQVAQKVAEPAQKLA